MVAALVEADRLRPAFLFDQCRVVRLDDAALRADPVVAALDPELDSVVNVNEPAEYEQARDARRPEVTVQCFGAAGQPCGRRARARSGGHAGPGRGRRVASLLDRHVVAALNGEQITRDGRPAAGHR